MTAEVVVNGAVRRIMNDVPAFFTVTARTWPTWNVNTLIAIHRDVMLDIFGYPGAANGWFDFNDPPPSTWVTTPPTGGPNLGIRYLNNPYVINGYEIWINPSIVKPPGNLKPTSKNLTLSQKFYFDQNGINEENMPGGVATCTQTHMVSIQTLTEKHEGVAQNPVSHWGIANKYFPTAEISSFRRCITRSSWPTSSIW